MSRKLARESAFSVLFQTEIGHHAWNEVLENTLAEQGLSPKSERFLRDAVAGTIQNLAVIDDIIRSYAVDWKLERMANTDRNILRLAVYEIKYRDDIPPGASVNEAVELAKRYGDEESGKFVNGILGSIIKDSTKPKELNPDQGDS